MRSGRTSRAGTNACAALVSFGPVALVLVGAALAACEAPPSPRDGGVDAPFVRDVPPPDPCPPLGPLLEVTRSTCPEIDLRDRFCVVQDRCALELVGTGSMARASATVADRETTIEIAGITCVMTLDDEAGAALECDDSLGIGCMGALRGIAVADSPTCCVPGDASCSTSEACTLVAPASAGAIATTACVEHMGVALESDACTRGEPGHDDCSAGLFCTALGAAAGTRVCRRLCVADTGCATGDVCTAAGVVPAVGVCAVRCDPFAAPDACGAGLGCLPVEPLAPGALTTMVCATAGSGLVGELCEAVGCAPSLVCVPDPGSVTRRCHAFCDDAHPCAGTETCGAFEDGASLGTCVAG